MKKTVLIFGSLSLGLLILFQLSEYAFFAPNISIESKITVFAIVFMLAGILISRQIFRPKTIVKIQEIEVAAPTEIDHQKISDLGISKREYQVLELIAQGLSNKEIGEKLFVSENTIKTHVSNLLVKLNSRRRTEAVKQAKSLRIIE